MSNKILVSMFIILNTISCNSMETTNVNNSMEIDENYSNICCNLFDINNINDLQLPIPSITQQSETIQEDMYTDDKAYTFIKNFEKNHNDILENSVLDKEIPMFGTKGVNKLLVKYIHYIADKMDNQISEQQEQQKNIINTKYVEKYCYIAHEYDTSVNIINRLKYLLQHISTLHYNNFYIFTEQHKFDHVFTISIRVNPDILEKKMIYTFTNNDNIALINMLNIVYLTNSYRYCQNYISSMLLKKIINNNEVINNINFSRNLKYYISYITTMDTSNILCRIDKELQNNSINDCRIVALKKVKSIINNINTCNSYLFPNKTNEKKKEWNAVFALLKAQECYEIVKDTLTNNCNKELIISVLNNNTCDNIIKYKILKCFILVIFEELSKNNIDTITFDDNEITEDDLYFIKKQPNITNNNITTNKKIDNYFLENFLPLLQENNFYNVLDIISLYSNIYSNSLKNNTTDLLVNMMFSKFINNSDNDDEDIIEKRMNFVDEVLYNTICDKESTIKLFNIINNDNTGESKYTKVFVDGMIKLIVKNNDSNNVFFEKHVNNIKEVSHMLNINIKVLFRNKMNQFLFERSFKEKNKDMLNEEENCKNINGLEQCFRNISKCMSGKIPVNNLQ